MSKSAVITTRLDPETLALVDQISKAQGRSRSWFAARAIERMVRQEADFMAFVQAGIDAADRSDMIAHEDVFADIKARRSDRANG